MNTIDNRLAPYGVFVLRVGLGAMWIAHALWWVIMIPENPVLWRH